MLIKVFMDLMTFEGFSNKVYRCPAGKWTVGYGRNLEDNGITRKEAEYLLLFDISKILNQLDRQLPFWKKQPVSVQMVLIQMAFQMGIGGLLTFRRFLAALQVNDYQTARFEMLDSRWANQTPLRAKAMADMLNNDEDNVDIDIWKEDVRSLKDFAKALEGAELF